MGLNANFIMRYESLGKFASELSFFICKTGAEKKIRVLAAEIS